MVGGEWSAAKLNATMGRQAEGITAAMGLKTDAPPLAGAARPEHVRPERSGGDARRDGASPWVGLGGLHG